MVYEKLFRRYGALEMKAVGARGLNVMTRVIERPKGKLFEGE